MEYWDVYDGKGQKTGKIVKRGEPIKDDEYHLGVIICIINSNNEILISKRCDEKEGSNKWELAGGSALAGEDSITAALRESHEELGVKLSPSNGEYLKRLRYEGETSWLCDVWLFKQDVSDEEIALQEEEVSDYRWATKEDILELN